MSRLFQVAPQNLQIQRRFDGDLGTAGLDVLDRHGYAVQQELR